MLFWHIFTKSNIILTLVLHILNPLLTGNIITHPPRNTSLTKFIKAHVYHLWQNSSFCRDKQAQRSSTTKPSWASPAHTQILAAEAHVSWPTKFQHNLTAGAHSHQVPACPIRSEDGTCPLGVKPVLHKLKLYHFSCDIKLKATWQKAGRASASCPFFLLQSIQSRTKSSHD